MSFLSDTKGELSKEQNRVNVRTEEGGRRSCVYNGKLYIEVGQDRFHAVPLGMDEARDMKQRPWPDIMVKDGIAEEIRDREIPEVPGAEDAQATDEFENV